MIMAQFGKTIPRILRIRHHKCLEYFELFLPRTWTSQSFAFDVLEIIQCVFIKRETMTEITCKSYATYSTLF